MIAAKIRIDLGHDSEISYQPFVHVPYVRGRRELFEHVQRARLSSLVR